LILFTGRLFGLSLLVPPVADSDTRSIPGAKKKQLFTSAELPWTDFFVLSVPEKGIEIHLVNNDCF
jgi:hypothetical protein